jgi:hypothetical protein
MLLESVISMLSSVALITAFMYGARLFCNNRVEKVYGVTSASQIDGGNHGYVILRLGIFTGIAIAMLGTINGSIMLQAGNGVLALIFIFLAIIWSDKVLFPDIDDRKEIIVNGNTSMGIVFILVFYGTRTMVDINRILCSWSSYFSCDE